MYVERKTNKKKILCAWVIVAVLTSSIFTPNNTSAATSINVPVGESGNIATKEVGLTVFGVSTGISLDAIAWGIAKGIIAKLTNSMVKWIGKGRGGGAMFATDPEKFFRDDADNVYNDFYQSSTNIANAAPYQSQVNVAVQANYNASRLSAGDRTPYTPSNPLLGTKQEQQAYLDGDFSKGGWDQWFAVTQGGGNVYAAAADAQNQLATREQLSQQTQQMQLNWGNGFTSWADCVRQGQNGVCSQYGPTKTPGSVIEAELKNRLGSGVASLTAADGLNEVLGDVLGDVLNSAFGAGEGIFASNTTNVGATNGTAPIPIGSPINVDYSKLVIVIAGPNPENINLGDTYREYGAQAIDPDEGDITNVMTTTGSVDTNQIGTYTITYSVTDKKGTTATATRTVNVVATSATGGTCSPKPVTGPLNSDVTWTLVPTGGSGVYKEFIWDGDNTKTSQANTVRLNTALGFGFPTFQNNNNVNLFPVTTTKPTVTVNYGTPGSLSVNVTIIDASSTISATKVTCSPNVFIYNP